MRAVGENKRAVTIAAAFLAALWLASSLCAQTADLAAPGGETGGRSVLEEIRAAAARLDASRRERGQRAAEWWRRHTEGAPYTGRHRLMIIPERQEIALGEILYRRLLSGAVLSANAERLAQVRRVSARLIAAADLPDWDWKVDLLDAGPTAAFGLAGDQDKAFALTGGKVGVLTGLVEAAGSDAGLAAVLSHEIAHAVARHLGERLSETILLEAGLSAAGMLVPLALAVVIPALAPAAIGAARLVTLAQTAYGLGTPRGKRLLVARFTGAQEAEADYIGMVLMAKAGYDPQAAAAFWEGVLKHGSLPARTGLAGLLDRHLALHAVTPSRVQALRTLAPAVRARYLTADHEEAR